MCGIYARMFKFRGFELGIFVFRGKKRSFMGVVVRSSRFVVFGRYGLGGVTGIRI